MVLNSKNSNHKQACSIKRYLPETTIAHLLSVRQPQLPMSKSIDLKHLFSGMQQQMEAQLNTNRNFINQSGAKGDALENVWIQWLRTYLPNRYQVDKAIVIDATGATSDQIDLVIYDQQYTPFVFNQNGFKYIPAEGVYAVFEVKPDIKGYVKDLSHIAYAGEKIASVRKLNRTSVSIINAGKPVPARPLTEIVGGILASTNSIVKESTLKSQFESLDGLATLDLSCAIEALTIDLQYDQSFTGAWGLGNQELNQEVTNYYQSRKLGDIHLIKTENAMIVFFLKLVDYLQQRLGTVAAIDLDAYLKNA